MHSLVASLLLRLGTSLLRRSSPLSRTWRGTLVAVEGNSTWRRSSDRAQKTGEPSSPLEPAEGKVKKAVLKEQALVCNLICRIEQC